MAFLDLNKKNGNYYVRFRINGSQVNRSLKTKKIREAENRLGPIDEAEQLLKRGRIECPPNTCPIDFVMSGGKAIKRDRSFQMRRLADLFKTYNNEIPTGSKENSTLRGEKRHQEHLLRHLGKASNPHFMTPSTLQEYVAKRAKDIFRGSLISPGTIEKELVTFRLIWNWATKRNYLTGESPTSGVILPKQDEKPPFATIVEIERKIKRGGLSDEQIEELWKSVFLTQDEIAELIKFVTGNSTANFVLPMFVFVAHTGARRSEIIRSRVDDFDFETGVVKIREKKKVHKRKITFRHIPLTPLLAEVMQLWFANHPGGQYTLCQYADEIPIGRDHDQLGMSQDKAHYHFDKTLGNSKWNIVRGFHVFRHSFASNLALKGIDQRYIDDWMGHQTETMRRRYRHLFPNQNRELVESVFGDGKEAMVSISQKFSV